MNVICDDCHQPITGTTNRVTLFEHDGAVEACCTPCTVMRRLDEYDIKSKALMEKRLAQMAANVSVTYKPRFSITRLTSITLVLMVTLVCDVIANVTRVQSDGWDATASVMAIAWAWVFFFPSKRDES